MEDTQEHNDHHTGPETSEENTPRTQEGLGTRAEGAHNEDTTEREDTGHERENREENGHGNEEQEQRRKERSDDKEMTDRDEETAVEEQKNESWDEDKDNGEGGTTTMAGGIPDMPPPLSPPRIRLYKNGAEKISRRQQYNRRRARMNRSTRITAELTKIIQAEREDSAVRGTREGSKCNGKEKDTQEGERTAQVPAARYANEDERHTPGHVQTDVDEASDPNAIIRKLQEQLRNMRAQIKHDYEGSEAGEIGTDNMERRHGSPKPRSKGGAAGMGARGRQQREGTPPTTHPPKQG